MYSSLSRNCGLILLACLASSLCFCPWKYYEQCLDEMSLKSKFLLSIAHELFLLNANIFFRPPVSKEFVSTDESSSDRYAICIYCDLFSVCMQSFDGFSWFMFQLFDPRELTHQRLVMNYNFCCYCEVEKHTGRHCLYWCNDT